MDRITQFSLTTVNTCRLDKLVVLTAIRSNRETKQRLLEQNRFNGKSRSFFPLSLSLLLTINKGDLIDRVRLRDLADFVSFFLFLLAKTLFVWRKMARVTVHVEKPSIPVVKIPSQSSAS